MKKLISLIVACICAVILITLGVSQEVPVGGLHGTVEMAENGHPLVKKLVVISPVVSPDDDDEFVTTNFYARTDANGQFSMTGIPAGAYRVEVEAQEHQLKSQIVEVQEGSQAGLDLRLKPSEPTLSIAASQRVIAPKTLSKLEVDGFIPLADDFKLSVRRLKLEKVVEKGGVRTALEPVSNKSSIVPDSQLDEVSQKTYTEKLEIRKRDEEGAFVSNVQVPPLSEGLYLVTVSDGKLAANAYLNVSRVALVTKTAKNSSVCYVADIKTGRPIAGAPLFVPNGQDLKEVAKTDGRGLARVTMPTGVKSGEVLAKWEGSVALSDIPMNSNRHTEDDDDEVTDPDTRIFTYADRPVYRPGDTVHFKSIVRHRSGLELKLPTAGQAKVKILDDQENLLQTETLPISSHGTIEGDFTTNSESKPGVYKIEVHAAGGVDNYYANLADYRKPDYSVTVTPKSKRYVLGDTAEATVYCQYYFGGPVVGAKVTATIYRNPAWSFDDDSDEDVDVGDSPGGEYVQEVQLVTDGTGKALLRFPTTPSSDSDSDSDDRSLLNDYRYSVQASVSASTGHSFDGSGSFLVTRGNVHLTVSTDPRFLVVNKPGNIVVQTHSLDDNPKPVSGVSVQVAMDVATYTEHTVVYEPLRKETVVTDATGTAKLSVTPTEAKNIRIRATAVDSGGRKIETESDAWVEGSPDDPDAAARVKVKVDKKHYAVGDTAKILVTTNRPDGVALLAIESDDIKQVRTVDLKKGSAVVEMPIEKSMFPNAFVSVCYVHNRIYCEDSTQIRAERKDKKLVVTVTPDENKALPGSKVGFKVKTTDVQGQGVPANVSFGLVDESVYAIKPDTTDIKGELYPHLEDLVETNFSFPEVYLDGGDKAGGSVPVRRKFLDTAAWVPNVETDPQGNAHVSVKLPDNLTSWRATVVGATDDTAVGMTTANMVANKPLMVRITAPQFLVATDSQSVGADITNDSGQPLVVKLAVRSSGIQVASQGDQSLNLDNGQTVTVPLPVSSSASGQAVMTATVTSDKGFSDAVESKLPILPHARLVEDSQAGTVNGRQQFKFNLAANRDPNAGGLEVTVTPSIASGLIQSLDALVRFPYGCVEQTLSRFLPAVRVVKTIKGTPLERQDLAEKADKIAADGFARLEKMQHKDGGWGWWTYDDSDPFMTAWVLDGFKASTASGHPVPPTLNLDKALHWAADRAEHPLKDDEPDGQIFLLLAAAEYGRAPDGAKRLAAINLEGMTMGGQALAALAADKLGAAEVRDKMLEDILTQLRQDHIKVNHKYFWWSDDEQLALALRALVTLRPNAPEIAGLISRLEQSRKTDGWISTRATTIATLAECDYLDRHPQIVEPGELRIGLNGTLLKTIDLDPAKADIPNLTLRIPIGKLKEGANTLTFADLKGRPYVSANLRQYDVEPELKQVLDDRTVTVQRAYYRMEPTRLDDGTQKLLPSKHASTQFKSGDTLECVVTLHCDHPVDFLFVEDPLPSNCRITEREDPMADETWGYWWSDMTIMDDRVAFFARQMPAGTHLLTYMMRAEGAGVSTALPTHAQDMYVPSISASGSENRIEVKN